MSKLKKSRQLISVLTLSILLWGNSVQAVSDNAGSDVIQSISDNSGSDAVQSISDNAGSDAIQSISNNSGSDAVQSLSDNANKTVTDDSGSDIIKLICPTDYPFFIATSGKEAYLNSQIFHIANYSNKDIQIDFANVHLEPGKNVSYNELSAPMEKNYVSETKEVFAFLKVLDTDPDNIPAPENLKTSEIPTEGASVSEGDFILTGENKTTEYKVLLKASNYNEEGKFVSLQPESIFSFYIAGNVTQNKNVTWNAGDIKIKVIINYTVFPSDDIKSQDSDAKKSQEARTEEPNNADLKETSDTNKEEPLAAK